MKKTFSDCNCPGCLSMMLEGIGMLVVGFASLAAVLFGPLIVALSY